VNKNIYKIVRMKLHVLNGFLGSGKTTAIQLACLDLSKKKSKQALSQMIRE